MIWAAGAGAGGGERKTMPRSQADANDHAGGKKLMVQRVDIEQKNTQVHKQTNKQTLG